MAPQQGAGQFTDKSTATAAGSDIAVPLTSGLSQNYPNPFSPTTSLEFSVSSFSAKGGSASGGQFVSLKVFDLLGREIATLIHEERPAGTYRVRWDAAGLPSGMYLCRL